MSQAENLTPNAAPAPDFETIMRRLESACLAHKRASDAITRLIDEALPIAIGYLKDGNCGKLSQLTRTLGAANMAARAAETGAGIVKYLEDVYSLPSGLIAFASRSARFACNDKALVVYLKNNGIELPDPAAPRFSDWIEAQKKKKTAKPAAVEIGKAADALAKKIRAHAWQTKDGMRDLLDVLDALAHNK